MDELGAYGIKCEILSVAKTHYISMQYTLMENRLQGPFIQLLIDELLQLQVIKDKVDHPRSGGKDLADATCGAIFNAIEHTPKVASYDVDFGFYEPQAPKTKKPQDSETPKATEPMPEHVKSFLDAMQVL